MSIGRIYIREGIKTDLLEAEAALPDDTKRYIIGGSRSFPKLDEEGMDEFAQEDIIVSYDYLYLHPFFGLSKTPTPKARIHTETAHHDWTESQRALRIPQDQCIVPWQQYYIDVPSHQEGSQNQRIVGVATKLAGILGGRSHDEFVVRNFLPVTDGQLACAE